MLPREGALWDAPHKHQEQEVQEVRRCKKPLCCFRSCVVITQVSATKKTNFSSRLNSSCCISLCFMRSAGVPKNHEDKQRALSPPPAPERSVSHSEHKPKYCSPVCFPGWLSVSGWGCTPRGLALEMTPPAAPQEMFTAALPAVRAVVP